MLRPDANDQSKLSYPPVPQTPRPPTEEKRPYQPEEGTYQPGVLPGEGPAQVAYREYPAQWNPPGKLVAAPSVKPVARGLRTASILALALVIAAVFGVGLFAGWRFSRSGDITANSVPSLQSGTNSQVTVPPLTGNNIETVREAAIAKVKPAVVQVNATVIGRRGESGVQSGSGVVVDKRGYIVTNNHVVQGSGSIEVVFADGNKIENVRVAGADPNDDLAVLKVTPPTNMVVATLGDSSKLQVGEDVLAIGNPLGITETVTHGIISALGRSVPEDATNVTIPNTIQTDAPINPGNSGGALADLQGNVIGIPTLAAIDPEFNAPASGVGFAIRINQVKLIVPQIIQNGSVTHTGRATLGITSNDVDPRLQAWENLSVDHGVYVAGVQSGGPSAQAGLQQGDVIVAIDGKGIDNDASLQDVLATKAPGNKVSVSVYRGAQQLTFNVTLGELQAG